MESEVDGSIHRGSCAFRHRLSRLGGNMNQRQFWAIMFLMLLAIAIVILLGNPYGRPLP
jgi:hypothetical protein